MLSLDASQCVADLSQVQVGLTIPFRQDRVGKPEKPQSYAALVSCVIAEDGHPSPLLLMRVEQQRPVEVQLKLLISDQIALAASVDLLDERRQVLRNIRFDEFVRRGGSYTGSIFLNEDDTDVAFLLMRPDQQAVGESDTSITGQSDTTTVALAAGGGLYMASIRTGSEVLVRTWLSEMGSFSIRAVPTTFVLSDE